MINLKEVFETCSSEYMEFKNIKEPLHPCPDVCAFILLNQLVPNPDRDMVSASEHDQIFLSTDCDHLARVATPEDILFLTRCGVCYDEEFECLFMYT